MLDLGTSPSPNQNYHGTDCGNSGIWNTLRSGASACEWFLVRYRNVIQTYRSTTLGWAPCGCLRGGEHIQLVICFGNVHYGNKINQWRSLLNVKMNAGHGECGLAGANTCVKGKIQITRQSECAYKIGSRQVVNSISPLFRKLDDVAIQNNYCSWSLRKIRSLLSRR